MDCVYEKPEIEKVIMRPKKTILSGPEYSESWSGRSCFKICRTKSHAEMENVSTVEGRYEDCKHVLH